MPLQLLHSGKWTWHISDPRALDGWFDQYPRLEKLNSVKNNPARSVFTAADSRGNRYYVKHDSPPIHGWAAIKARFRSKTRAEFNAAQLLDSLSIPCVNYLGWAKCGQQGMLISKAIPDAVNAKNWWFSTPDPASRANFLIKLRDLVSLFAVNQLRHPDFHLGNILVIPDSKQLLIVDPYGISQKNHLSKTQRLELCKIFVDLRGDLHNSLAESLPLLAKLAKSPQESAAMWNHALKLEINEISRNWPRRRQQILQGNSKFSSTFMDGDRVIHLRHHICYSPMFSSPDDPALRLLIPKELPTGEAQKLWLESFRTQLFQLRHDSPVPLAWQVRGDNSTLYFPPQTPDNAPLIDSITGSSHNPSPGNQTS